MQTHSHTFTHTITVLKANITGKKTNICPNFSNNYLGAGSQNRCLIYNSAKLSVGSKCSVSHRHFPKDEVVRGTVYTVLVNDQSVYIPGTELVDALQIHTPLSR